MANTKESTPLDCGMMDCPLKRPHWHCQFVMKLVSPTAADPISYQTCKEPTRRAGDRHCWHHSRH
jgi:hypothetical protein